MLTYWQKDPRWKDLTIGETKLTMEKNGCYICSIAYLKGKTPDVVLGILNRNNAFTPGGLLDNYQAAKVLGMNYRYVFSLPNRMSVAETNYYREYGYPQHFFVWLNDGAGNIMDPLDGKIKKCGYNIISYRLWDPMPPEFRTVNTKLSEEQLEKKKGYCNQIGLFCESCDNEWCKEAQIKGVKE